jgi:hypothetical protein
MEDLKKFYRKIIVAEEVFVNRSNFNPIRIKHAPGAGAGAAILICGSVEPEL